MNCAKLTKISIRTYHHTYEVPLNPHSVWVNMDLVRYMYWEEATTDNPAHTTIVFEEGNPEQHVDGYITVRERPDAILGARHGTGPR